MQFGLAYCINNLPIMTAQLGAALKWTPLQIAKFSAGLSMAAVVMNILAKKTAEWMEAWGSSDRNLTNLELMNKRIEEQNKLIKEGKGLIEDRISLRLMTMEKEQHETAEKYAKNIREEQTSPEKESSGTVKDALVEKLGRERLGAYAASIKHQLVAGTPENRDPRILELEESLKSLESQTNYNGGNWAGTTYQNSLPGREEQIREQINKIIHEEIPKEVDERIYGPAGEATTATGDALREALGRLAKNLRGAGDEENARRIEGELHALGFTAEQFAARERRHAPVAGGPEAEIEAAKQRASSARVKYSELFDKYGEKDPRVEEARKIAEEFSGLVSEAETALRPMVEDAKEFSRAMSQNADAQKKLKEIWDRYSETVESFGRESEEATRALNEAKQKQAEVIQEAIELQGEENARAYEKRKNKEEMDRLQRNYEATSAGLAGATKDVLARLTDPRRFEDEVRRLAPDISKEAMEELKNDPGARRNVSNGVGLSDSQMSPQSARALRGVDLEKLYNLGHGDAKQRAEALRKELPDLTEDDARKMVDEADRERKLRPFKEAMARRQRDTEQDAEGYMGPARAMGLGKALANRAERGQNLDEAEKALQAQLRRRFPNLSEDAAEQITGKTREQYEEYENGMAEQRDLYGPLADPRVRLRAMLAGEFGRAGIAQGRMMQGGAGGGIWGRAQKQLQARQFKMQEQMREAQWERFGKYVDPDWGGKDAKAPPKDPVVAMTDLTQEVGELKNQVAELRQKGIPATINIG